MKIIALWFLSSTDIYIDDSVSSMRFIMIYFNNHTEAALQAKVKKRKTLKQVLQEKEEKAKEQALKSSEEAKSVKEVKKMIYFSHNISNIPFHVTGMQ